MDNFGNKRGPAGAPAAIDVAAGLVRASELAKDAEIARLQAEVAELYEKLAALVEVKVNPPAVEPAPKKDRAAYMREYQRKRREVLKAIPKP